MKAGNEPLNLLALIPLDDNRFSGKLPQPISIDLFRCIFTNVTVGVLWV